MTDSRQPIADSHAFTLIGPGYPFRGGIAHFLETMYTGLRVRGHRTAFLTFTTQYPELLFPGKTQFETDGAAPFPTERILSTINPLSWWRTAQRVIAERPDAIVFKFWMPFFGPAFGTVARLVKRHGIRTLAVVDNALPHERRPGDVVFSRYFLQACDGLIVMSESVEADLETLEVPAPVRRIRHPVYTFFGDPVPRDEARASFGLAPEQPTLLFFGFVRRYKGLHVLLEAMPRVMAALPDVRLIVAGEFYEDEAPYREMIRAHGLEKHVLLESDYIPNDAVARYFSAADVVVQPYVSATQSGVAQVAYQFEKPLVVTDVGGLAEVVPDGEAGLVVPPEQPEALADALVRYFREDMAGRLTEGVRREKQKYSWDRLYEAMEDLLA